MREDIKQLKILVFRYKENMASPQVFAKIIVTILHSLSFRVDQSLTEEIKKNLSHDEIKKIQAIISTEKN